MMYDIIIIGKGPAGISASLYTKRANLKTLIIGKNESVLKKASKIENYYGFSEPVSGEFLLKEGEKQAERIGVEIVDDQVIAIEKQDYFEVATPEMVYTGRAVILATGQSQKKISIENLEEYEGKGVSYCSTCDGFFYNNLKVGVVGYKDYAVHEAIELLSYTKNITIYTNGMELDLSDKFRGEIGQFQVNTKKIQKIDGDEFLQKVYFADESNEEIDGLFIAYDTASSSDFARKLGLVMEGSSIRVDKNQLTNLQGLFAAGDCTGGFKQIATAVAQGAIAGKKSIEYIRSL